MTVDAQNLRDPSAPGDAPAVAWPRLGQAVVSLAQVDPWSYADLGRGLGGPAFLWHEPGREAMAAFGSVDACPGGHVETMKAWCSRVGEQVVTDDPPGLLFVGGLPFGDRLGVDGSPWAGWEAGGLWLPRVLIRRRGRSCEAVITAEDDALEAWTSRVRAFDSLRRPLDPPTARSGHHTLNTCGEREAWTDRVGALVDAMVSPNAPFSKVVLARAQQLEASPGHHFDAVSTAFHLRAQQPGCTSFAWFAADGTAFVGATPELLCRVEGERLEATALAGTAPRGRAPAEDDMLSQALEETAKERHEHRLVVDGILEALVGLGADASAADAPRVRRLQDVQHLETPITGTLPEDSGLLELVEALHPTPAVGGVPREAALRWLRRHEGLDRGHYAAPIGWMSSEGAGAFFVALRSVLLTPECAWAFAGAGIVAGSSPEAEWREVNHKLRAVRNALTCRAEGS